MKRHIAIILLLCLFASLSLTGCKNDKANDKPSIVCTVFPQYDWVLQILGDKAENFDITLLLNNRVDLHSYQPSVENIIKISTCDLFIYIGGISDGWVMDALKEATNRNMIVLELLEVLGAARKLEEIDEDKHEHSDPDEHVDQSCSVEYDEHVWLSLKNAGIFCAAVAEALSSLDKENAPAYQHNASEYAGKLSSLDDEYRAAVNTAPTKTIVVGDRFPFRYLTDDYDLSYYTAFKGCSAETEASFETIIFLAEKMDELGLRCIIVTESSDKKIAEAIIRVSEDHNRQILVFDVMQSVTPADIQNGATYLSIMEKNLNTLKEALK